jgi:hypothetical protein
MLLNVSMCSERERQQTRCRQSRVVLMLVSASRDACHIKRVVVVATPVGCAAGFHRMLGSAPLGYLADKSKDAIHQADGCISPQVSAS